MFCSNEIIVKLHLNAPQTDVLLQLISRWLQRIIRHAKYGNTASKNLNLVISGPEKIVTPALQQEGTPEYSKEIKISNA